MGTRPDLGRILSLQAQNATSRCAPFLHHPGQLPCFAKKMMGIHWRPLSARSRTGSATRAQAGRHHPPPPPYIASSGILYFKDWNSDGNLLEKDPGRGSLKASHASTIRRTCPAIAFNCILLCLISQWNGAPTPLTVRRRRVASSGTLPPVAPLPHRPTRFYPARASERAVFRPCNLALINPPL